MEEEGEVNPTTIQVGPSYKAHMLLSGMYKKYVLKKKVSLAHLTSLKLVSGVVPILTEYDCAIPDFNFFKNIWLSYFKA